jgi:hypothetical protein
VLDRAPQMKSRKTKVDAKHALAALTPHGGSLSAADFDKFEWAIMYPFLLWRVSLILPDV